MRAFLKLMFLALPLTFAATLSAATSTASSSSLMLTLDPGATLVTKITQGKAKITQEFTAVGNINGYVLSPASGSGGAMIIYADNQGKYLFLGNLIDPSGKNLSAEFTQKYVVSVTAKSAIVDAQKSHWIVDGKDSAPHQAYIYLDPNCIYCHLLYKEVFPLIDSGQLQVRWIPVGFLKASSPGKSAALLQPKDPATADDLLRQDELKFDAQKEEGGIKALDNNKTNSAVFDQVSDNTALFNQYGFQGTPTLIYVDKTTGQPSYYPGYLGGQDFQNLVSSMGKAW